MFARGLNFDHHKQTKSSTFRLFPVMTFSDFDIYLDHAIPDCDKERTVGATSQQRVLTPPRHLIRPLSSQRPVLLCFEFLFRLMDFEMVKRLLLSFFIVHFGIFQIHIKFIKLHSIIYGLLRNRKVSVTNISASIYPKMVS